jgi:hypothetical protein
LSIGQILGLNHSGGGGGFLSHLLGQHNSASASATHQHHHMGGEPDQTPSWNMAMQAEKGVLAKFLKIRIRATPALGFLVMFGGFALWLGVVYMLRHSDPGEKFNTVPAQSQAQTENATSMSARDSAVPVGMPQSSGMMPMSGMADPAPMAGATYAAPAQQMNNMNQQLNSRPFGRPGGGQYSASYPVANAPMGTGAYAGVPYGYTPQPRLRVVINH